MSSALLPDLAQARDEFLATGDERLLPIVDAHHHFWDLRNPHPWLTELPRIPFRYGDYAAICKDFLPSDYVAACDEHRVLRHVVMEGEWTPDDPAGEALWMLDLAHDGAADLVFGAQLCLGRQLRAGFQRARGDLLGQAFPDEGREWFALGHRRSFMRPAYGPGGPYTGIDLR